MWYHIVLGGSLQGKIYEATDVFGGDNDYVYFRDEVGHVTKIPILSLHNHRYIEGKALAVEYARRNLNETITKLEERLADMKRRLDELPEVDE
jgi:hypothetical protein